MTADEFVKNNRGVNEGDNLPEALLRRIFRRVSSRAFLHSSGCSGAHHNPTKWLEMVREACSPEGGRHPVPVVEECLQKSILRGRLPFTRELFGLSWRPLVASLGVGLALIRCSLSI